MGGEPKTLDYYYKQPLQDENERRGVFKEDLQDCYHPSIPLSLLGV